MKELFIANCPRCSIEHNIILKNDMGLRCKCKYGYWINIHKDGAVDCSYSYNDYFIYSSEKIGETSIVINNREKWINKVLDPFTSNKQLDNILLLI